MTVLSLVCSYPVLSFKSLFQTHDFLFFSAVTFFYKFRLVCFTKCKIGPSLICSCSRKIMARIRCTALSITFLLILSLSLPVFADENEVDDETPFTYGKDAKHGPGEWGDINPKWQACGKGKLQSPIDLSDNRVQVMPQLGTLERNYKPAPADIKNRGHDITVVWQGDAGGAKLNGTEYHLLQCHWHTPSEHTLNGKSFDMEIHMVHNNSLGHIAVIGILYEIGQPDPFLSKLLETIKKTNHDGIHLGVVDPSEIDSGSRTYYRYLGSLTVPPCTEGVLWTIVKEVKTVSKEQIKALRDAVHDGYEDNARPTQSSVIDVSMYRPENKN